MVRLFWYSRTHSLTHTDLIIGSLSYAATADVFGVGPLRTWPFPTDPIFDDFDRIMGFSTPQRLLREQILRERKEFSPV
jgi:hypothetical protein